MRQPAPDQPQPDQPAPELITALEAGQGDPGATYRARLQRDMVRGSLWTLIASTIALPITLVVSLVVVRTLGPHEYGRFALYVTAFAVVLGIANAGISEATVQWLAAAHARGDTADEIGLVRRCAGYHVLIEAPIVAVVSAVLLHGAPLQFLVLAVVGLVATLCIGTSTVVLSGTARNDLLARITLATTLATQTATALSASTQHTAAATWAAQWAVSLLGPVLALSGLPPALRRAVLRPTLFGGWPDGFLRYALSASVGGLVTLLVFGRSEIFVLRAHSGPVVVAVFAVATTIAGQITVPIDSLMGPLHAGSAGLIASAPELAQRALARALRLSSLLGAATVAIALPVAVVLVQPLFGTPFGAARGALIALGAASCVQSVTQPLTVFGFATRSAGAILRVNLICLAVDAALAFALIPTFGLGAAVTANVAAAGLSLVLTARVIMRRLHVKAGAIFRDASPFAMGIVAAAIALASTLLGLPAPAAAAVAAAVGLAALIGGLLVVPRLRIPAEDADALSATLPKPLTFALRRLPFLIVPASKRY